MEPIDPVVEWSIREISRTQYGLFNLARDEHPEMSEQEIAQLIFERRINSISPSIEEKGRAELCISTKGAIRSLREACHAIAVVEFRIHPSDGKNVSILTSILDGELELIGYMGKAED